MIEHKTLLLIVDHYEKYTQLSTLESRDIYTNKLEI